MSHQEIENFLAEHAGKGVRQSAGARGFAVLVRGYETIDDELMDGAVGVYEGGGYVPGERVRDLLKTAVETIDWGKRDEEKVTASMSQNQAESAENQAGEITDSFEIMRAIVHPESEDPGKMLRLRGDLRAQLNEDIPPRLVIAVEAPDGTIYDVYANVEAILATEEES
jgi:hypothetical protein